MTERSATPIIHLTGPKGSGKTTLCRLFLDAFPDKSVLAVDASEDQFLTLSYGITSPITVGQLIEQIHSHPISREAMDWALQDLPIPIPSEADAEILVWDNIVREVPLEQMNLLQYALPRLLKTYDLVIWEGPLGTASAILNPADIQSLVVITPQDESFCQQLPDTPAMVLLSKAEAVDILPPTAAYQIQRGNWKFLGKLPSLSPPEKRIKELPQNFQDCFNKLDLPFELRSGQS